MSLSDWWWSRKRAMTIEEWSWIENFNDGNISNWTVTSNFAVSATHKFEGAYGVGGTINNCYGKINFGREIVNGRITIRQKYLYPYPNTQPFMHLQYNNTLAYGTYQTRDADYARFHEFNGLGYLLTLWPIGTYNGQWLKIVIEWNCTTDRAEIWLYDQNNNQLAHYTNRNFSSAVNSINTIKLMLATTCSAYWDLIVIEELP